MNTLFQFLCMYQIILLCSQKVVLNHFRALKIWKVLLQITTVLFSASLQIWHWKSCKDLQKDSWVFLIWLLSESADLYLNGLSNNAERTVAHICIFFMINFLILYYAVLFIVWFVYSERTSFVPIGNYFWHFLISIDITYLKSMKSSKTVIEDLRPSYN